VEKAVVCLSEYCCQQSDKSTCGAASYCTRSFACERLPFGLWLVACLGGIAFRLLSKPTRLGQKLRSVLRSTEPRLFCQSCLLRDCLILEFEFFED